MTDKHHIPELLAPAGSYESLRAALAAGADAVYFGHSAFSNRMRAKNFGDDGIRDAIKLCHDCGAAAHITINTRIRDREYEDAMRLVHLLYGGEAYSRPDALIVADFGIARAIKEAYPDAVLHASTQTSLSSPADCEVLSELGFSRLVVPRELSFGEISALSKEVAPFEIEAFVHGAHCVSLSGQCLMSYVQGGRSGNRGECAQPCRLPFATDTDSDETERLSLADMCLAGRITDVIRSGVASLKIEGRLKPPAYVYGVTSIYRRLLDEGRNATQNEINQLRALFYRGFTDGYFAAKYRDMTSTRVSGSADKQEASSLNEIIARSLKERIVNHNSRAHLGEKALSATFTAVDGAPISLTLRYGDTSATALGDTPAKSDNRPLTIEAAAKNLTKFGGTGFTLDVSDISFDIGENLWLPLSAINALRRDALEQLVEKLEKVTADQPKTAKVQRDVTYPPAKDVENVADIASFRILAPTADSVRELTHRFDRIYVSVHEINDALALDFGGKLCASLPVITPNDGWVNTTLEKLKESGITRVLCHTIGQVRLVQKSNLVADMSFRANITSTNALKTYVEQGCASITLSPELVAGGVKNLGKGINTTASVGAIAYGRFPVMTTARCVIAAGNGGKCPKGNFGGRRVESAPHFCTTELIDRLGERFPVIAERDCTNVIYNSTPIWMGDRLGEIRRAVGATLYVYQFTTETADEAIGVFDMYQSGQYAAGRRI